MFPINLRLEVDEYSLAVPRRTGLLQKLAEHLRDADHDQDLVELRVRLRHCYIRYYCDGLAILADSKYRSAIKVGSYSEETAAVNRSSSSQESGGSLSLTSSLDTTSAKGLYSLGAEKRRGSTLERTVIVSQDIYEVEAVPGGWRVGDRVHGDPLKNDGCLSGPYLSRVVEGYAHSCEAEFLREASDGSIRFEVTTRDGLHVERVGGETASASERSDAVEAMRNKLAAICLEQSQSTNIDGEVGLFTIRATCISARVGALNNESLRNV